MPIFSISSMRATWRCAFSEGRFFDVELPWDEVGSAFAWILVERWRRSVAKAA